MDRRRGGIFLLFLIFQQWRIAVLRKVDAAHQKERETQATYSHLFNNMPILYMQERPCSTHRERP